jgi:citrate lyase subunit beta/citryl-CoA lyase
MTGPLRSMLFAPGNHPRRVEKVFDAGADAAILDLEDAVAISEKVATRATVVAALQRPRPNLGYVRVNAFDTEYCFGDIHAIVGPGLDGIMLPKVESAAQLQAVEWMMRALERERGLEEGAIDLLPIVENGLGLERVEEIARSGTRVRRLSFGAGDFTHDMGYLWTLEEGELHYPRSRIAVASRAARLDPPIDTVFVHLNEMDHFEGAARIARGLGYQGKLCIHPKQVATANAVFTPTDAQIAEARKYIDAFRKAEAEGSASIQVDGYFVDYPIIERSERILALAEAIAARGRGGN